MGSAIGDYIHYHASRYKAFGLEKGFGKSESEGSGQGYEEGANAMKVFVDNRRKYFESQYNLSKLQKSNSGPEAGYLDIVKDIINNWDTNYNGKDDYQKGIKKSIEIIKDLLKQRFGKTVAEKLIKMSGEYFSGIVKGKKQLTVKQKVKIKGLQKIDTKSQHYVSTIQRTLDQLYEAVASLRVGAKSGKTKSEKAKLSDETASDYYEKIRKWRSALSDYATFADQVRKGTFAEDGYKAITSRDAKTSNRIINDIIKGKKGPKLANQSYIKEMYKEINTMIGELKVEGLEKQYVGQAFQLVCAMGAEIAAIKATGSIKNLASKLNDFIKKQNGKRNRTNLNGIWTGWQKTNMVFEGISFLEDVPVWTLFGSNYIFSQNIKDRSWNITTAKSQDKVDISFTLDNKDFFLSAKNYHLTKRGGGTNNVHIVSQVPFLVLLLAQAQKNSQFVNHFLNIEAARWRDEKSLIGLSHAKNLANEAMKIIIAEGALKGYRDVKANMFILNDSTTGEIKMVSTDALLYVISLNLNAYLDIESTRNFFNNKWNETPTTRITSLLQDAYNRKISASINGDILKDVSGMGGISRGI